MYFRSQAWGQDPSDEAMLSMSRMIRTVRNVINEYSVRRGRPLLLAVRVPDSDGYRRAMGLDLEAWLRDDLVDIVTVSDYFRLTPWQESIDLGHRYGKRVFACLSESRERDKAACSLRNSIKSYRARTMQALEAGADGIYLFNAQDVSNETLYTELGDPGRLRGLPKVYVSTVRGVGNADFWVRDGVRRFLKRDMVCPSRPLSMSAGKSVDVPLAIGDEGAVRSAPAFVLQLLFSSPGEAEISLQCNGSPVEVTRGGEAGEWLADIEGSCLQRGDNVFSLIASRDTALCDVLLWVFPAGAEKRLEAGMSIRETMKWRNERVLGKSRSSVKAD